MKHEYKLKQPIDVNGERKSTLAYDFDEITSDKFLKAEGRSLEKMRGGRAGAFEFDYGLHLYLTFEAITAVEESVDINDLERIKGYDIIALQELGRNFITGSAEERLEENDSENLFGPTPSNITHQQTMSGDSL